jgi:hypothetical protein
MKHLPCSHCSQKIVLKYSTNLLTWDHTEMNWPELRQRIKLRDTIAKNKLLEKGSSYNQYTLYHDYLLNLRLALKIIQQKLLNLFYFTWPIGTLLQIQYKFRVFGTTVNIWYVSKL